MATFSLASCGLLQPSAKAVIAKADEALENGRYKLAAVIDVSCDNEELDEALGEIMGSEAMDMDIYIDGKNIRTEIAMDAMGVTVAIEMTVVNNVLYYSMGDYGKIKAVIPEDEMDVLFGDMGADTSEYNPDDFENITMENKNGKYVITCTEYDTEKLNDLLQEYGQAFEYSGAKDVSLDNVALVLVISDGKYESITMSMDYAFTIEGEEIVCSMSVGIIVDYSKGKEIVVPADADTYTEVDYDKIGMQ